MEEAAQEQHLASFSVALASLPLTATSRRNLLLLLLLGSPQHILRWPFIAVSSLSSIINIHLLSGLSQLTQTFGSGAGSGFSGGQLSCSGGQSNYGAGANYGQAGQHSGWSLHDRDVHNIIDNVAKGKDDNGTDHDSDLSSVPGPLSPNTNCGNTAAAMSSSPVESSLLSPSSPSHCNGVMPTNGHEDSWRGSSIASLRRRAFEHSGISMSVFR